MRIIAFCMIVVGGVFFPWWFCVVTALLYAFWYSAGYELFLVGIMFDASYGAAFSSQAFPYIYTSCMAVILLSSLYVRNYISFSAERKKI